MTKEKTKSVLLNDLDQIIKTSQDPTLKEIATAAKSSVEKDRPFFKDTKIVNDLISNNRVQIKTLNQYSSLKMHAQMKIQNYNSSFGITHHSHSNPILPAPSEPFICLETVVMASFCFSK